MGIEGSAVVFPKGVHRHVVGGVEVTLVVPEDVTVAQLAQPLARIADGRKEAGDGKNAA